MTVISFIVCAAALLVSMDRIFTFWRLCDKHYVWRSTELKNPIDSHIFAFIPTTVAVMHTKWGFVA